MNVGPTMLNAMNGSTILVLDSHRRLLSSAEPETQPVGIGTGSLHQSFIVQTRRLSVKFKQFREPDTTAAEHRDESAR